MSKPETLEIVTIAGADYTVEQWADWGTVIISSRGTAYTVEEGHTQPHSFPAGTPLRKRGNPVYVLNVGGIIEEVVR